MMNGNRPTIYGDGLQSRDFTHVDNVVAANLLACTAQDASGAAVNMACGDRVNLNDLVALINRNLGTDLEPLHTQPRPGDDAVIPAISAGKVCLPVDNFHVANRHQDVRRKVVQ